MGSVPAWKLKVDWMVQTRPIAPSRTSSATRRVAGWQRYMNASIRNTSFSRAASTTAMASA